jgi:hypothetical protein
MEQKKDTIIKLVEDITRTKLKGKFLWMVLSPIAGGGSNMSFWFNENVFMFGHNDDWQNYSMVYVIHEIFHSLFGHTGVEHAIMQLAIDNELRIRLNGSGTYFEENGLNIGHRFLRDIEKKILPYWKEYLKSDETIYEFRNKMVELFGNT